MYKYLSIILFFCIALPVSAQAVRFQNDPNAQNPELYVHDITLDQAAYAAGDEIAGSFALSNVKASTTAENLYYQVQLVGNFGGELFPRTLFGSSGFYGPFALQDETTQRFDFTYQLPDFVSSNDLGIQIHVYEGKTKPSARRALPFAITGTVIDYLESITQIQVDGEVFGLLEGPTVYEGETLFFATSLQNESAQVTVTPTIQVYDHLQERSLIETFSGESLTIARGGTEEQRIALPIFEYRPGIYTAIITYTDKDGDVRAGPFEMRYVVSVLDRQIGALIIDQEQKKADVTFIDYPVDVRATNYEEVRAPFPQDLRARVTVLDQLNTILDTQEELFVGGRYNVSLPLNLPAESLGLTITTELIENGEVIDTETRIISEEGIVTPITEEEKEPLDPATLWGIIVGVLVAIILLTIQIIRRRKKAQALLILLFLGFGIPFVSDAKIMHVESFGEHVLYIPYTFQIQNPLPPVIRTYAPGEVIPFHIDYWSAICSNGPHTMDIRMTTLVPSEDVSLEPYWRNWEPFMPRNPYPEYVDTNAHPPQNFADIIAPDEPGMYRIYFQLRNNVQWSNGQRLTNEYVGYVEIEVEEDL